MQKLSNNQCISVSIHKYESDLNWLEFINDDNNEIATVKQMHSSSHNATCFKYIYEKYRQYQYDFLCLFIDISFIG